MPVNLASLLEQAVGKGYYLFLASKKFLKQ